MGWNYAELSKAAKEAGGPEEWVKVIEEAAKQEGKQEILPRTILASVVFSGITCLVTKWIDNSKMKKAIAQADKENAKKELIQGIKDYDATHSQDVDGGEVEKQEDD